MTDRLGGPTAFLRPPPRASRLTLTTVRQERRTDVVAAMRELIIGEAQEIFLVAAVDGDDVRDVVEVARGDYHSVRVSLRQCWPCRCSLAATGWWLRTTTRLGGSSRRTTTTT